MASVTGAVHTQWGKAAEKQIDADGHESWKEQMYVDMIPWEYDRFRELLEKYSKIPPEEVTAEILKIVRDNEGHDPFRPTVPDVKDTLPDHDPLQRDKAWEVAKYPCIGYFTYVRLLEFGDHDPGMPRVIERLKAPGSQDTFLELGGFMFQTIRRLAFEGADSTRLYGTDLHNEFIDLGYLQFRDRETLQATFVAGDMLAGDAEYEASELARTFNEKISIVHASNFFHLFTWESQLVICERIMRFFRRGLSPESPAVLFGNHYGSSKPGVVNLGAFRVFLHDEKTFQSLWDEIGRKTNTKWNVTMRPTGAGPPKPNVYGEDARNVHYVVSQEG